MRQRSKISTVLMSALLLIGLVGVVPAQASNPTRQISVADAQPNGLCQAAWYYRSTSRGADSHFKIGPTQSNYNGTTSTATSTFSAQASGTVGATINSGEKYLLASFLRT